MELSPQTVAAATFKTTKKGYDPEEVRAYLIQVSTSLEAAHQQAAAMEARARAAISKLQEVSQNAAQQTPQSVVATETESAPARREITAAPDEAETISRTLLLAQRTADLTVADAKAEAAALTAGAKSAAESTTTTATADAKAMIDQARSMSGRLVDEARTEARRSAEDELLKAEGEVQSLLARRDFLVGDVDHLEQFVGAQRERLRDASVAIQDLIERVPGGLGEMRRPLLSASADDTTPSTSTASDSSVAAAAPVAASAADPAWASESATERDATPVDEPLVGGIRRDDLAAAWRDAEAADDLALDSDTGHSSDDVDPTPVANALRLDLGEDDSTMGDDHTAGLEDMTQEMPATRPSGDQGGFRIGGSELR